MKKKLILLVVAIAIIILVGMVLFENLQKPQISNTLSDRSLEFIESQSASGQASSYQNLLGKDDKEDFKGKRVQVGECFSFVMPYSVFNHRQEGECNGYFAFDRPKGSIVAYMVDASSNSLDSAPGVSMRRLNPDQYEEREIKAGGREFLGFVDKLDQFTITLYHNTNNQYLIFTLKLPRENQKELEEILASLEFN